MAQTNLKDGHGAPVPEQDNIKVLHPSWHELDEPSPSLYTQVPRPVETWLTRAIRTLYTRDSAGKAEAVHDREIESATALLAGTTHVLTVGCNKGGSGKSTTAQATASTLSEASNTHAVLLEANPTYGTLRHTTGPDVNPANITDLLRDLDTVSRGGYSALRRYLTMYGRLAVLPGPSEAEHMASITPADYDAVLELLARHFSIVVIDTGPDLFSNRINNWALQAAHALVFVVTEDIPTLHPAIRALRHATSPDYERVSADLMADLTVMGRATPVRSIRPDSVTVAANRIGDPACLPLDWNRVAVELGGVPVVQLPYDTQLPKLLNSGRLTPDNIPTGYRRAVKRLLATSLTQTVSAERKSE